MANPLDALKKATGIGPATLELRGEMPISPGKIASSLRGLMPRSLPDKLPKILQDIFSENPAAQEVFSRYIKASMPEVEGAIKARNTAKYAQSADAHDALLDLVVSERPRLIPTKTGIEIAIPKEAAPAIEALQRPGLTGGRWPNSSSSKMRNSSVPSVRSLEELNLFRK